MDLAPASRAALLTALLLPAAVDAATFVVDTGEDRPDVAVGDGLCRDAEGECSLRAAVQEANALAGADRILLGNRAHSLSLPAGPGSGDLLVSDDLSVEGRGPGLTSILAATGSRHFQVVDAAFSISGVALRGGASELAGGSIWIRFGPLAIDDCLFEGNTADGEGGAVCVPGGPGPVTIRRTEFRNNESGSEGGALLVASEGSVLLEEVLFDGNRAASGAAVFAPGADGGLVVRGCEFVSNVGPYTLHVPTNEIDSLIARTRFHANEGGPEIRQAFGTLTLRECWLEPGEGDVTMIRTQGGFDAGLVQIHVDRTTFSGESRVAIDHLGFGDVEVVNSTFSGCSINAERDDLRLDNVTMSARSFGVRVLVGEGAGHVRNSILGSQLADTPVWQGSLVSGGHNVFAGPLDLAVVTGDHHLDTLVTDTDFFGVDEELADLGGFGPMLRLLPGSPAIDGGDPDGCLGPGDAPLPRDQRFQERLDGNADGVVRCDAGAFESCGGDADGDGLGDACDCAPGDPAVRSAPQGATLLVTRDGADVVLTWSDLAAAAGSATTYEVARGPIGSFGEPAPCTADSGAPTWRDAGAVGGPGSRYLVRGVNPCTPAEGGWGRRSDGVPRVACP